MSTFVRASAITFGILLSLLTRLAGAQTPAPPPPAAAVQSAEDDAVLARTRALMDVMQHKLADVPAAIERGELEGFFDFGALSAAPIAANAGALNNKQKAALEGIFSKLVRQLAYASGAQFREGRSSLNPKVRHRGDHERLVDIAVSHPDDDVDSQVSFVWTRRGHSWRVVDVQLDGASIEKDYENQFAKIIKRDGADGLIKKMKARLGEAQQKVKAQPSGATAAP